MEVSVPSLVYRVYDYVCMQLIVLVNGEDMFQYELKLPPVTKTKTKTKSEQNQYFVGGGAVSTHTSEKHISLVNATNYSISWKLGVLSILPGEKSCIGALQYYSNILNMYMYMYMYHVQIEMHDVW